MHDFSQGPGFADFMTGLDIEEPDWIHVKMPGAQPPADAEAMRAAIFDNLSLIYDPEIPINIVELGLIYDLTVGADGQVDVLMTLTAPNCPVAGSMPAVVERGVMNVPGTTSCNVELTWDPPWSLDRASEDARLALGW